MTLEGTWSGTFFYPDGNAPVGFTITLEAPSPSGVFRGQLKEPNTFSQELIPLLRADVEGLIHAHGVEFTKRYTEGADHSVTYEGTLTADGKHLIGSWCLGSYSGPFAIHMDRPGGELPMLARRHRRLVDGEWIGKALFTDSAEPLRVSLIQSGARLGGRVTQGKLATDLAGREKEQSVKFQAGEGAELTRYTGWLSPNGKALGGGLKQGALTGHWLLVRDGPA